MPRNCERCGKEIIDKKHPNKIYCSRSCWRGSAHHTSALSKMKTLNTGKPRSLDVRIAISESHLKGKQRRIESKDGYRRIHKFNTKQYEHRLVVEAFLGRKLKKQEIVHHIDGKRDNNNLSNLRVFQSQKEHRLFHSQSLDKPQENETK